MMQEAEVVAKIQQSYRFVDLIFGTHNIYKFAELLVSCAENDRMIIDIWKDTDKIVEDLPAERKYSFQVRCQYHVRLQQFLQLLYRSLCERAGAESKNPKDIVREIEKLVRGWRSGGHAPGTECQFLW